MVGCLLGVWKVTVATIHLQYVYAEMLYELQQNKLTVVLQPQHDPTNVGACVRLAIAHNCEWYRKLCADFESNRLRKYNNFKTKVKRKDIERILKRLIAGKSCSSIYARWIIECAYATACFNEKRMRQEVYRYSNDVPF
jgi:crotonobetainyl-CoA:carnitine CoA-transferase CaiB-like acyl-CoA transferase